MEEVCNSRMTMMVQVIADLTLSVNKNREEEQCQRVNREVELQKVDCGKQLEDYNHLELPQRVN